MIADDRLDPDEYTPDLDPVTAAEEYEPEVAIDDSAREANPADVAEQLVELPADDEPSSDADDND